MGDPSGRGGPALSTPAEANTADPADTADPAGGPDARAQLFPNPPAPAGRPGWRVVLLAAGAVVLGTLLSLLRQPGAGPLDTLWAEDGSVFLSDATVHGSLAAAGRSYAGYFNAVPRLIAGLVALAPAGWAATLLAVAAALGTALVALLVYVASAGHLASGLSRAVVAGIVLVVPVGQGDVLNSPANLHWYGLYALFWVLIWTPYGRAGRTVAAVVVLLVAASDVLVLAFVPLALLRATRRTSGGRRDRHGAVLATALGLGLAVQIGGLLFGSSSRALSPDPVRALTGYVLRAVPGPLVGERWLGATVNARWLVLAGVAWLVVAAAVILARTTAVRPAWPLAIAAALHSVALYALPVVLTGVATPRYAVPPAMLVVTALVALLPTRLHTGRAAMPGYALVALLVVVCASNLRLDNPRGHGPRWSTELDRARAACQRPQTSSGLQTAGGAQSGGADRIVEVPIPPAEGSRWRARLPCDYLQR